MSDKSLSRNFGRYSLTDKSLEGATYARAVDIFIASYPNSVFPEHFVNHCSVYFIDCYETYCPDGCDGESSEDLETAILQIPYLLRYKRVKCPGNVSESAPAQPKARQCIKIERRVYLRAHLGELTEDEVKFVRSFCGNSESCVFRQATDISLDTPEERLDHYTLLKRFDAVKAADREGLSKQAQGLITIATALVKVAVNLRTTRKRAWGYSLEVGNIPGISAEQSSSAILTPSTLEETTQDKKRRTADEKLRDFLDEHPECHALSSRRLAMLIGEKPATVRKTSTWIALSKKKRLQKKQNAVRLKLNNDDLSEAERKRLERELDNLEDGEKR